MAITPTLQDLINQLPGTLGQGIMSPEEQAAEVQRITSATLPEALRKYGTTAQQIAESNFGRGFGLSSYNAYQQALNTLMQQEGTANIQNQAQQSVDAAQKSAVANAASYANAGQNRQQQSDMQKHQIAASNAAQNKQAIIGGLGNVGIGAAGMLTRDLTRPAGEPSRLELAYNRIKDAFGPDKAGMAPGIGPDALGGSLSDYDMGGASTPSYSNFVPDFNLSANDIDFGTGNLLDYSFSPSSVQLPDFSLESLFSPSYDWGDYF
jgi:hypothetical protein